MQFSIYESMFETESEPFLEYDFTEHGPCQDHLYSENIRNAQLQAFRRIKFRAHYHTLASSNSFCVLTTAIMDTTRVR